MFFRPLTEGGKRTIFLVNTVVLAKQQMLCIKNATSFTTTVYTGDMNVDAWRKDKWFEEFNNSQVLVATCQIILDVIRHGYITFKHINLIIFDECHHGRRDHPMHQLMRHYFETNKCDRPRIIGLTGMLIGGSVKPQSVVPELEALENTFHSTIATVKSLRDFNNVLVYSTNPKEIIIKYVEPSVSSNLYKKLETLINKLVEKVQYWPVDETHTKVTKVKGEMPNFVKFLRTILNDFLYQLNDMGNRNFC